MHKMFNSNLESGALLKIRGTAVTSQISVPTEKAEARRGGGGYLLYMA